MKEKWAELFRKNLEESGTDCSPYSDEELLLIAKGAMAPQLCQEMNIRDQWVFEIYWYSLLAMDPASIFKEDIDLKLFITRADKNKN